MSHSSSIPGAKYAPGYELAGPLPLAAIALFALNNFAFKGLFHNALTGKLSDLTCCFFLPLFISATLAFVGVQKPVVERTTFGAVLTALVLIAVKTSEDASNLLNAALGLLVHPLGMSTSNVVDPSDLLSLPLCAFSVLYARLRLTEMNE